MRLIRALLAAIERGLSASIGDTAFFALVASGASISDVFNLRNAKFAAILAPVVDSCQITLQQNWGSAATNSAGWFTTKALNPSSSGIPGGDYVINQATPVGSACFPLANDIVPTGLARLKTSVAMTNPTTFAIVAKW